MILRYDQGMNTHHETPRPMPGPHECTCRYAPCYVCADPNRIPDPECPVHGEAPGDKHLADPEDARPRVPLNGPVRVGDEVRQDAHGLTRTAIVGLDITATAAGFGA